MLSTPIQKRVVKWTWSGAGFTREKPRSKQTAALNPLQVYKRARYYDPATGEFISRDPLEYVDGMSLYRGYFVPGAVDPFGLDHIDDLIALLSDKKYLIREKATAELIAQSKQDPNVISRLISAHTNATFTETKYRATIIARAYAESIDGITKDDWLFMAKATKPCCTKEDVDAAIDEIDQEFQKKHTTFRETVNQKKAQLAPLVNSEVAPYKTLGQRHQERIFGSLDNVPLDFEVSGEWKAAVRNLAAQIRFDGKERNVEVFVNLSFNSETSTPGEGYARIKVQNPLQRVEEYKFKGLILK